MSFRWFVYYCAMVGGCAAYVAWALGRWMPDWNDVLQAALQGVCLGALLGFGIGLVDSLGSTRRHVVTRPLLAFIVGALGGFVGGAVGQILFKLVLWPPVVLVGWTITGLLIGMAPGMFDVLSGLSRDEDLRGVWRKVINGLIGGTLGGFVGGGLYLVLDLAVRKLLGDKAGGFWSPSALGFIVLGLCIGLLIGLAQVILKVAWLRVVEGFRPGRELILAKAETTVGRAESCDVGLFGDSGVERLHAKIVRRGHRFILTDEDTPEGTYLNGELISGPTPLSSGDIIRVGRSVLRFGERRKQSADEE